MVAWIALGSNLGDRARFLAHGRDGLARLSGSVVIGVGVAEETPPLGFLPQPPYLNQMVMVETTLDPLVLLAGCHAIEQSAGRTRDHKWASRTLDLDVVRFDDLLCDVPGLTLPHPGLRDREFWAREIALLEAHA